MKTRGHLCDVASPVIIVSNKTDAQPLNRVRGIDMTSQIGVPKSRGYIRDPGSNV